MSEPYLSQLMLVSFNFAPKGWAQCNGTLLPINQNQALFSLLGTTYGGDGRVNFALPDLRGRTPIGVGTQFSTLGERGGEDSHTVIMNEMPAHNHMISANAAADSIVPNGGYVAGGGPAIFSGNTQGAMAAGALTNFGGSQPHENRQPYLVLNWVIALQGIFPSQN